MRKAVWSLVVMGTTLLVVMVLPLARHGHDVTEAKFAVVERADVHQVIPITGHIAYAEEQYIYAEASGLASQVCVREGVIRTYTKKFEQKGDL